MVQPKATAVKASKTGLCLVSEGVAQRASWFAMLVAHASTHVLVVSNFCLQTSSKLGVPLRPCLLRATAKSLWSFIRLAPLNDVR